MLESPRINSTFGPILIGSFIGLVMYGMTVQTTYRYFRLYPTDSLRLKGMIIVLIILDTLQMVEASHTCYYYVALHYSDAPALATGVWSTRLLSVTRGMSVFIVQMFYCRRISVLAPAYYKYLAATMVPLMLAELGFSIAAAVEAFIVGTFARWEHSVWIDVVALAIVLVADVMLAAILVAILHRSRTGIKRTDSLLDLLIIYTVNTCVLTSFVNALTLIFLLAFPHDLIYVGISIPAAQTYSISVLAVVNSRKSFAKLVNKTHELGSFGLSDDLQIPPNNVNSLRSRSQLIIEDTRSSTYPSLYRIQMPTIKEGSQGAGENKIEEVEIV